MPIPGTEQYADFMREGLITERNLDRYDATHLLFRHQNFNSKELSALLFKCYRKFFNLGDSFRKATLSYRGNPHAARKIFNSAVSCIFYGANGVLRRHPMSGGVGIRTIDHVEDYLPFRRKYFGDILERGDLMPLPGNLELSEADAAL
jgi:hypothetical protein